MPGKRRIVRVRIDNEYLCDGLHVPAGVRLCRIVPCVDTLEFGWQHWIFFESEDFPELSAGQTVPEWTAVLSHSEGGRREMEIKPFD
jgi:hypothetical protein